MRSMSFKRRLILGMAVMSPVIFYAIAVAELFPGRDFGRLYGAASCINVLAAGLLTIFLLALIRRMFSAVSLEDRARMDHDRSFKSLTSMQQDRIKWAMSKDLQANVNPTDEREAAMRRDTELVAFRVFKRALPIVVTAYWTVSLTQPLGPLRVGLLIGAVGISGLAIALFALPGAIFLWKMQDSLQPPRIMDHAGD